MVCCGLLELGEMKWICMVSRAIAGKLDRRAVAGKLEKR
jgi:hypothetical protein